MRMWMVNPKRMCRKHLLGEHVELHMLWGSLRKQRSIQGFLDAGLLQPQDAKQRHDALVREMKARGYKHSSPPPRVSLKANQHGTVDTQTSEEELRARCEECKARLS
jgi:hypothetical protein